MLDIHKLAGDGSYLTDGDPAASYGAYLSDGVTVGTAPVFWVLGQKPDGATVDLGLDDLATCDLTLKTILPRLMRGAHPRTGAIVVAGKRKEKGGKASPPGAYELQASVPKSLSVLSELGEVAEPGLKAKIADIHRRALQTGLQKAFDLGLICMRKKGRYVPVAQCVIIPFEHDTSRADDPLGHIHAVLLKSAYAADGAVMQIDNKLLMDFKGALAALIRCEEVRLLREELGIAVDPADRNYEVKGVPRKVVDIFSKRREMITGAMAKMDKSTARHRDLAQAVAYETRSRKSHEASDDLRAKWVEELQGIGWTPGQLVTAVRRASEAVIADPAADSMADRMALASPAARKAVAELAAEKSIFSQADLFRTVFEAVQCHGIGATCALDLAQSLISDREVIRVSSRERKPMFTHRSTLETEQAIIRDADHLAALPPVQNPQGRSELVHLAQKHNANPEQAAAFADILAGPGLALLHGAAGTGKTYLTKLLRVALTKFGYDVIGTAPSHKATTGLRNGAAFEEAATPVLAKLLNDIDSGRRVLTAQSFVVLDEAGMVTAADMHRLLAACAAAGARLLLQGDTQQYRPVGAGRPFALLCRLQPPTRLEAITRQQGRTVEEGEWMRAASTDFSQGQTTRALEAYDRMGHLDWHKSAAATIAAAVESYVAHRQVFPHETRAMTIQWNEDVSAVTVAVRARLKALNLIEPDDIRIRALPRGRDHVVPVDLALTVGDEVIFGESVTGPGWRLNNADICRIEGIEDRDSADPLLSLAPMEQGSGAPVIHARLSHLVGRRDGDVPAVPRFQHAYAITGHAAQGITVDAHFDIALRPRGREGTYVCATRHRQDFRMFIDLGRLADDRNAEAPTRLVRDGAGVRFLPPIPVEPLPELDLKHIFFAECDRDDRNGNLSDDIPADHLREWAFGALPTPAPDTLPLPPTDVLRQFPLPRPSDLRLTPASLQARIRDRIDAPEGHSRVWQLLERTKTGGGSSWMGDLIKNMSAFFWEGTTSAVRAMFGALASPVVPSGDDVEPEM